MVPHGLSRFLSIALCCTLGAACASASFDGHVYQSGELRFQVGQVPSAWRTIHADGALFAYRDDAADATIAVNGRCHVDGDDVPLASLTQHLFLEFTHRDVAGQKTLTLDGRAAMRTEIDAALDGVPKHFVVYVLKKDSCVYDFLYIAAGSNAGTVASFDRFVQGFATLE